MGRRLHFDQIPLYFLLMAILSNVYCVYSTAQGFCSPHFDGHMSRA